MQVVRVQARWGGEKIRVDGLVMSFESLIEKVCVADYESVGYCLGQAGVLICVAVHTTEVAWVQPVCKNLERGLGSFWKEVSEKR